jgi:hypothetical protein
VDDCCGVIAPCVVLQDATKDAPVYLHTQRYLTRTPVMKRSQPKSIVVGGPTGLLAGGAALSVNWHGVTMVPTSAELAGNVELSWERYGYVHHYRASCKYSQSECDFLVNMAETDTVMPFYRRPLQTAVMDVMQTLRLLPPGPTL